MVVCCCVRGCSNDWRPNSNIQFHRFPLKNEYLLKDWVIALSRPEFIPKNHTRICSNHFLEEDYSYPGSKNLKSNAVPSIFHNVNFKQMHENELDITDEMIGLAANEIVSFDDDDNCNVTLSSQDTFNYNLEQIINSANKEHEFSDVPSVSTQTTVSYNSKKIIPTRMTLKRTIKILQQKLKRRDEKVLRMRKIILSLKKEEKAAQRIKHVLTKYFNGFSAELFRHQYRNNKVQPKQRRYSEVMKEFALKLYFYSPRAYKFVRDNLQLPHCATLRKNSRQTNSQPQIQTEITQPHGHENMQLIAQNENECQSNAVI